jgi:hypothetical protein
MWATLILFSVAFCSYFTIHGIIEYCQCAARTSIQTKSEAFIEFPALTFCLTDFFSKPEASRIIIYDFIKRKMGVKIANLSDFEKFFLPIDSVELGYELQQNLNLPTYNDSQRRSIGFNKTEFILDCKFNQVKCNMSSIIWYFNPVFGKFFVCLSI